MSKTEKVIEGMRCCTLNGSCPDCPYFEDEDCNLILMQDALEELENLSAAAAASPQTNCNGSAIANLSAAAAASPLSGETGMETEASGT